MTMWSTCHALSESGVANRRKQAVALSWQVVGTTRLAGAASNG